MSAQLSAEDCNKTRLSALPKPLLPFQISGTLPLHRSLPQP